MGVDSGLLVKARAGEQLFGDEFRDGWAHRIQALWASAGRKFDFYGRTSQLLIDGSIFAFSLCLAYIIRFEGLPSGPDLRQLLVWMPIVVAARLLIHWGMGIYRFIWRFVCLPDAIAIGYSTLAFTGVLFAIRLAYPVHGPVSSWLQLPLSILALEFLLSFSAMLAARVARRVQYEGSQKSLPAPGQREKRVLLYGAGRAGILLLHQLRGYADIEVIGFVDDNPRKLGSIIAGLKVLGDGKSLAKVVRQCRASEVVVSIVSARAGALAQILAKCQEIPVPAKIVPTLEEIVKGRVSISRVREFRTEELLGRETFHLQSFDQGVQQAYRGKRILVTGAGGSIGSELVRQLLIFRSVRIAILDKDENSIYELEQELKAQTPEALIEPQIADLRYPGRLRGIFAEFRPEVVFHAGAHKHVPLMEKHPCEAILNNVHGTKNLLDSSCEYGVERFVFISSDKAVNPTNVMGATKRAGEKLVQTYAASKGLRAACVRFGNVMCSRGSVIPLFQKQIAQGGPIKITHPDIARFFMTIPEAVELVLCAGSLANEGTIFVLDMGSPRKILDLARQMIALCGLEPGKDIQIEITGLRPGEKLNEELVGPGETLLPTRFEKISMISHRPFNDEAFFERAAKVVRAAEENNRPAVYEILSAMRIGFTPRLIQTPH